MCSTYGNYADAKGNNMSTEALITMASAWTVIISLAGYFIIKVIRTPQSKKNEGSDGDH